MVCANMVCGQHLSSSSIAELAMLMHLMYMPNADMQNHNEPSMHPFKIAYALLCIDSQIDAAPTVLCHH
jgi:hypothetical protein